MMLVPVLVGVSILVFLVLALIPGDPAQAILGAYATPENVARLNAELGLDQPLPTRYLDWLAGLLQGDWGRSYALDRPVADVVLGHLGPTLLLAASALVFSGLFGVLAGVVSAIRHRTTADRAITVLALIGMSTPSFFLGLVLVAGLSVALGWFPTGNMWPLFGPRTPATLLHHLALPAVTLGLVALCVVARMTRTSMLEVLRQDYIAAARARGLPERRVIGRHALHNAMVMVVPVLGLQAGFVLGGAVYVETVYQWPGIGRMLVRAIAQRDLLVVQGGVMAVATCYVLITLAADVVQGLLDPRIRTA